MPGPACAIGTRSAPVHQTFHNARVNAALLSASARVRRAAAVRSPSAFTRGQAPALIDRHRGDWPRSIPRSRVPVVPRACGVARTRRWGRHSALACCREEAGISQVWRTGGLQLLWPFATPTAGLEAHLDEPRKRGTDDEGNQFKFRRTAARRRQIRTPRVSRGQSPGRVMFHTGSRLVVVPAA